MNGSDRLTAAAAADPTPDQIEAARLPRGESCEFRLTPSKAPHRRDDRYVLIGKGHVDPRTIPLAG
jgi:hypothetical protein